MGVDAEKLLREALDEPAPPPPADPAEDGDDDGHGHLCRPPALVVYADGGLTASSSGGTLLVAVWTLGVFAITYLVCSWLWSVISLQALVVFGWASLCLGLTVSVVMATVAGVKLWRVGRRGER